MKFSAATLSGVVVALLVHATCVRADLIPWLYTWSRSPVQVHADAPGTGYITLTDESIKPAVGDSNLVATNLRTYSTATNENKDLFTNKPYSLTLTIVDVDSLATGSMTFTGKINGWLTAQSSHLQNTFTGETTQSLVLGQHRYTATIGPYTAPGVPGSTNSGSIAAQISVKVESVMQLPEPSTFLLTSLGTALLGFGRLRSRRPVSGVQERASP